MGDLNARGPCSPNSGALFVRECCDPVAEARFADTVDTADTVRSLAAPSTLPAPTRLERIPGTCSAKNSLGVRIFFGMPRLSVRSPRRRAGACGETTYGWRSHAKYTESESAGLSAVGGRGGRVGEAKVTTDGRSARVDALMDVVVAPESRVDALR